MSPTVFACFISAVPENVNFSRKSEQPLDYFKENLIIFVPSIFISRPTTVFLLTLLNTTFRVSCDNGDSCDVH